MESQSQRQRKNIFRKRILPVNRHTAKQEFLIKLTMINKVIIVSVFCAVALGMFFIVNRRENTFKLSQQQQQQQQQSQINLPAPSGRASDEKPLPIKTRVVAAKIFPESPIASDALYVKFNTISENSNNLVFDIKWFVNDELVQSGPSTTLLPGSYRKGAKVYAALNLMDGSTFVGEYMTDTVIIRNAPPVIHSAAIEPVNAVVGTILQATVSGTDPDRDLLNFYYQWRVNNSSQGADSSQNTFLTDLLKKHDVVTVMVTVSDGEMQGSAALSNAIVLQNRKPKFISSPPAGPERGIYVYHALAIDPDGDQIKYMLTVYPDGMTIDADSGLIRWELPKGKLFAGRHEIPVTITADDGDGGIATQSFTIVVTDYVAI